MTQYSNITFVPYSHRGCVAGERLQDLPAHSHSLQQKRGFLGDHHWRQGWAINAGTSRQTTLWRRCCASVATCHCQAQRSRESSVRRSRRHTDLDAFSRVHSCDGCYGPREQCYRPSWTRQSGYYSMVEYLGRSFLMSSCVAFMSHDIVGSLWAL